MDIIDIELNDLEPISIELNDPAPSSFSSSFGPGIELLMNDKNRPGSGSTRIDLGDMEKLENELNELTNDSNKAKSDTRTLSGFASNLFGFGSNPNTNTNTNINTNTDTDSKLGSATVESIGSTKTWDGFSKMGDVPVSAPPTSRLSDKEKRRKKRAMLKKLDEWYEKGHTKHSSTFNMDSPYEEVEDEYETIMDEKRKKDSIKLQGWWFMTFINSIEYGNAVFDPFGLNLDGWGEQISEDIESYEEIFSELHDKYKGGKLSPEISLLLRVGFSAAVINITNKALSTATPGFNDVIRQSPELMKMFSNATVQSMNQSSPGFGFVNNILNPEDSMKTSFGAPPPPIDAKTQIPPTRPGTQIHSSNRPDIAMGRGSMFREGGIDMNMNNVIDSGHRQEKSSIPPPPPSTMGERPEMRGPQSVDINGLLSGLKTREVDIHEPRSMADDNDSMVSIASLRDSQNTMLPKRTNRRKQKSDRNTISLDI